MKKTIIGFVLAFVLIACGVWGKRIWDWRAYQNDTAYKAVMSDAYLREPIYKSADGKVFTRAQVLDAMMASMLSKAK